MVVTGSAKVKEYTKETSDFGEFVGWCLEALTLSSSERGGLDGIKVKATLSSKGSDSVRDRYDFSMAFIWKMGRDGYAEGVRYAPGRIFHDHADGNFNQNAYLEERLGEVLSSVRESGGGEFHFDGELEGNVMSIRQRR